MTELYLGGFGLQQIADIVMVMSRVGPISRDQVHIHIKNLVGENLNIVQAGFFFGLPHRRRQSVFISIGMASQLQPFANLFVVGQQNFSAGGVKQPGGGGDVAFWVGSFEGVWMGRNKFC